VANIIKKKKADPSEVRGGEEDGVWSAYGKHSGNLGRRPSCKGGALLCGTKNPKRWNKREGGSVWGWEWQETEKGRYYTAGEEPIPFTGVVNGYVL